MRRERIDQAQGSRHLEEAPIEEIGDVDVLRAMGMAAQRQPLGVSLWRLRYSRARSELATVLEGLTAWACRNGTDPELVPPVLAHWLQDVCRVCEGRGYAVVDGTPMLSDVPCGACGGSGRAPLPVAGAQAAALLEHIASLERLAAADIMRRLSLQLADLDGPG